MIGKINLLLFFCILILASIFRFYGINWDQDQHFHPDERFLTMVSGAISWPENLWQYLDTKSSPLNPQNRGYNFFVYGSFPVFFTKMIAEGLNKADYTNLTLTGRFLSALMDTLTVIVVFFIAKRINKSRFFPYLAMFFYGSMVLPIQLSHYYAVDSYLTFYTAFSFLLLTVLLSLSGKNPQNSKIFTLIVLLLGISLGLSVSSKISALLFLPVIALGLFRIFLRSKNLSLVILVLTLISVSAYLTVRLSYPYLFSDSKIISFSLNPKIIDNWKQLKSFDNPDSYFPPSIQWIKTRPYLFPLKNIMLWGLGLPLGITALAAVIYFLKEFTWQVYKRKFTFWEKQNVFSLFLALLWVLILFGYQGRQFVKALRYFYPLYPFLAVLTALFFSRIISWVSQKRKLFIVSVFIFMLLILIYPVSFISIYSRPHTRVQASSWIYQNIPSGSNLSGEHWDDFLPVSLSQPGMLRERYNSIEFPLYNEDNEDKWRLMDERLRRTDYIILTSNRLYGSIMTVPEKYPLTYNFYRSLFDGSLGFNKIAEFTSRPNIPFPKSISICLTPPLSRYGNIAVKDQRCLLPGISFNDDYSDETFTVYDHPKVLIFQKVKPVDYFYYLYRSVISAVPVQ